MAKRYLSEIWIYPIKSMGGYQLQKASVTRRGLEHDRRWMIIDKNNRFISQRECVEMALLLPIISGNINEGFSLSISHKIKNTLNLTIENANLPKPDSTPILVQVWDDTVEAIFISEIADKWLSNILGIACKLAYMPENVNREVDKRYAITGKEITSFSDGYPFLIIGQTALDFLNRKLETPITIDRFRPNFVFTGDDGEPHEEDDWYNFTIGKVGFVGVKPCARCPIPTIDQATGIKGKEPLKTLSTYRFKNNKVYFGQNVLHVQNGEVNVGDLIRVE